MKGISVFGWGIGLLLSLPTLALGAQQASMPAEVPRIVDQTGEMKPVGKGDEDFSGPSPISVRQRTRIGGKVSVHTFSSPVIRERPPLKGGTFKAGRGDEFTMGAVRSLPFSAKELKEPIPPAKPAAPTLIDPEITAVYRLILNKAPDPIGGVYYSKCLKKGMNIFDVRRELANSPENYFSIENALARNASLRPELLEVYQVYLQRLPDITGFEYWSKRLNEGMSRSDIETNFRNTDEAKYIREKTGMK